MCGTVIYAIIYEQLAILTEHGDNGWRLLKKQILEYFPHKPKIIISTTIGV